MFSLKAYVTEFGRLGTARQAAGLATSYWKKYTRAELVGQLKDLAKKLGRKPNDRDINAD